LTGDGIFEELLLTN